MECNQFTRSNTAHAQSGKLRWSTQPATCTCSTDSDDGSQRLAALLRHQNKVLSIINTLLLYTYHIRIYMSWLTPITGFVI